MIRCRSYSDLKFGVTFLGTQCIGLQYGTPARCTLQFVRRCYGLRGIYGRFDSKIRFEIESDARFDSRFDSNAKKNDSQVARPYVEYCVSA